MGLWSKQALGLRRAVWSMTELGKLEFFFWEKGEILPQATMSKTCTMLEAKVASVPIEDIFASVNVTPKHKAVPALWILPGFLTH